MSTKDGTPIGPGSPDEPVYTPVKVRGFNNYDPNWASQQTAISFENSPSMTKQEFAEESDINTIVEKFGLTGHMPENFRVPTYGDFTGINDYHQALNAIAGANEQFDTLPAAVRERFNNDPGQFVDFALDAKNAEELVKMGLATKRDTTIPLEQPTTRQEPRTESSQPRTPASSPKAADDLGTLLQPEHHTSDTGHHRPPRQK